MIVAIVGQSFGIGWGVAVSAMLYLIVFIGGIPRNVRAELKAEEGVI